MNTGTDTKLPESPITTESTTTKPTTSTPTAPDTSRATSTQRTTYGRELLQAYTYARDIGITTVQDVDKANLDGNLTRAQAAKMLSQFAIQVLERKPDTSKTCQYPDMAGYGDLSDWMRTSCQLGIMGVGTTKFNPTEEMSRAEFGTVLSRAIWSDTYNTDQGAYYTSHLQQLKKF
ncbi:MAG: hypothetical protein LBO09_01090 [Candidatus Peribacteria bacterium]|nr:hypothetical protein [Candidatus Peribacteria bacterium]